MSNELLQYQIDPPHEVIRYARRGYHVFVGCDDNSTIEDFTRAIVTALCDSPTEHIIGNDVTDRRDFAVKLVEACQRLVVGIGRKFRPSLSGIAPSLELAMQSFGDADRQGFIVLSDIDAVIRMQRTMEFEGPLRSVMQFHDDVAIVMIGSNAVINDMVGDYDRPFYMSFRVFRL